MDGHPFWNASVTTAGPLTQEDFEEMMVAGLRAIQRPIEPVVAIVPAWWVREQRAQEQQS